jgi:hypothetical protein
VIDPADHVGEVPLDLLVGREEAVTTVELVDLQDVNARRHSIKADSEAPSRATSVSSRTRS